MQGHTFPPRAARGVSVRNPLRIVSTTPALGAGPAHDGSIDCLACDRDPLDAHERALASLCRRAAELARDTDAPPAPAPADDRPKVLSHNERRRLGRMLDAYRPHTTAEGKIKAGFRQPARLALCGRSAFADWVEVWRTGEGSDERRAWLGGVVRCRSKACPVCIARRRTRDGEEVGRTAKLWRERNENARLYLATLTIRHGRSDALAVTYAGIRQAWRLLIQGRAWVEARERWGLDAFVVREEVTHGEYAGWHPHLHILWHARSKLDEVAISDWLYERWCSVVCRAFVRATVRQRLQRNTARYRVACLRVEPLPEVGTDFHETHAAEYVAKLGFEMAGDTLKSASKLSKHRTPLELLDAWTRSEDRRALDLYREWERATKGRRDLSFSKALHELRALAKEQLDQEAAEESKHAELVGTFPVSSWQQVIAEVGASYEVLEAAERAGLEGMLDAIRKLAPAEVVRVRSHSEETRKCGRRLKAPDDDEPPDD